MALTYKWQVLELQTTTEGSNENSVVSVEWRKSGYDENGTEGFFVGVTPLTSVGTSNFISFENLTEEKVLSWVQATIDADLEILIEECIQSIIAESNTDKETVTSFPWQ